jgi:cyclophilin family peptidyl-prolyl cis-trans isomerase
MAPKNRNRKPTMHSKKPIKQNSNKSMLIALAVIAVVIIVFGALALSGQLSQHPEPLTVQPTKVLLQTTAGNITVDLRTDKPITSTNFINLVKAGKYDGTTFHRTVAGFMIQGGQVNGVATINDEIGTNNRNTNYTIAMAKTNNPNSASSGFFINVEDNGLKYAPSFDQTYTVFGNVISGQDVVDAIANAPATQNPNMSNEISIPVNPVTILHATIVP